MNYLKVLSCIGVMALITYLIRMLPLTLFKKNIENNFINSFFSYVPYAVLGAMTFPDILYSTGSMISAAFSFTVDIPVAIATGKATIMNIAIQNKAICVFLVFILFLLS